MLYNCWCCILEKRFIVMVSHRCENSTQRDNGHGRAKSSVSEVSFKKFPSHT